MIRCGLIRLHRDDRGATSVLILLTVLALAVLVMMVWNTGEYAARRAHVQTAADSTAHATATWLARETNLIAAQNMLICQDASAETVWRAVKRMPPQPPTPPGPNDPPYWATMSRAVADQDTQTYPDNLRAELQNELQSADDLITGKNPALLNLKNSITAARTAVTTQYNMAVAAYASIAGLKGSQFFTDPAQAKAFDDGLHQAAFVLGWLNTSYVGGQVYNDPNYRLAPPGPMNPAPGPGPNGEGLDAMGQIAQNMLDTNNPQALYIQILKALVVPAIDPSSPDSNPGSLPPPLQPPPPSSVFPSETDLVNALANQVAPALPQNIPQQMLAHETTVFANQSAMMAELPNLLQQQINQSQTTYNCALQLAGMRPDPDNPSVAGPVRAPFVTADTPQPITNHLDLIRQTYAAEAAAQLGEPSPIVAIDPVNVHTVTPIGDARLWHPGADGAVPGNYLGEYPFLPPTFHVDGWESDWHLGWGHYYTAPIEQYYLDRVAKDAAASVNSINNDANNIDQRRQQLRTAIDLVLKTAITLQPQPPSLKVLQANPTPPPPDLALTLAIPTPVPNLPNTAPTAVSVQVIVFNTQMQRYVAAVQALAWRITHLPDIFRPYTDPFAVNRWNNNINFWRCYIMRVLGEDKRFMVLETYNLRPIPDWARGGMIQNATVNVQSTVITRHASRLQRTILNAFVKADPDGAKATSSDPAVLTAYYNSRHGADIAAIALAVATNAAQQIAPEVVAEWLNRPWPYEVTPPADPVEGPAGMTKPDRQQFFSFLAAATTQDQTNARTLMPRLFGAAQPMVAFAQGECFNWMEYNINYGGASHYDQVNFIAPASFAPWFWTGTTAAFIASPRSWRLCSPGGWSWQPRLAFADALYPALQMNQPFADAFGQAGIRVPDSDTADDLTLH